MFEYINSITARVSHAASGLSAGIQWLRSRVCICINEYRAYEYLLVLLVEKYSYDIYVLTAITYEVHVTLLRFYCDFASWSKTSKRTFIAFMKSTAIFADIVGF